MTDRREAWNEYLAGRVMDVALPIEQRKRLLEVWLAIANKNPSIALPTSSLDEEERGIYLSWNPPGKALDIEVAPNGEVWWFYIDLVNDINDGSDDGDTLGYLRYVTEFSAALHETELAVGKPPEA